MEPSPDSTLEGTPGAASPGNEVDDSIWKFCDWDWEEEAGQKGKEKDMGSE